MERENRHASKPADDFLRESMSRMEPLDARRVSILRAMTTVERFAMIAELNRSERARLRCDLRAKHPLWSEDHISREVAAVLLAETSTHVYWSNVLPPEAHPHV